MMLPTISRPTARLFLRIRWLAWGAIAALVAADLAVALAQPSEPEILPVQQSAAHVGGACDCSPNPETI